ncbi:D-glucuronyl C5-epimerase family protein [Kamptonema cortianum]|nr:D-glucuronyl C5-epimerase family protein [Geitlerinema splendidum]MDK3162492.1 D-glucuronyl C5-epimerase family protein [Kamptonema cortianum]
MKLGRLTRILSDYTVGRGGRRPSTASFWYLQAPARPHIVQARTAGLSGEHPHSPYDHYLFDQQVKLRYPSIRADGIPILHYHDPVGDQVNPEAAFQYGLGLADRFLETRDTADREAFLAIARYFKNIQTSEGDFPYEFAWYESKPPWASALAQARGVSIMLRAHRLAPDEGFLDSATKAISKFDIPVEKGGFLAEFSVNGKALCHYFEEYPGSPTAVINGFMSTIFGLWELATWESNERAQELLNLALDSLEVMLPHYEVDWWTLYDRTQVGNLKNIQSPFYHDMVIEYMKIISEIDKRECFRTALERWQAWNTPVGRLRATFAKLRFKVAHR